jgi:hypothetical protein
MECVANADAVLQTRAVTAAFYHKMIYTEKRTDQFLRHDQPIQSSEFVPVLFRGQGMVFQDGKNPDAAAPTRPVSPSPSPVTTPGDVSDLTMDADSAMERQPTYVSTDNNVGVGTSPYFDN